MSSQPPKLPRSASLKNLAVFCVVFLLGASASYFDLRQDLEERKSNAFRLATAEVSSLSQRLNAAISLAYTLETLLTENDYKVDQATLERFAPHLLRHQPSVSSLQYVPNGVVSFIVPLQGNEAAIGHDLLADPKRNKEAFDAVEKHALTLAGPFELVQGGVAVIARLPIFKPDNAFWGFSTVLIRIEDLFSSSQFNTLSESGFTWNIYRIHPDTGAPQIFFGPGKELIADAVQLPVDVPNARWYINLRPTDGWLSGLLMRFFLEIVLSLSLATIIAYLFRFYQIQPYVLQQQVESRTAELKKAKRILEESENRIRQIAENEEMWIWEVDADGLYTYCSQTCEKLFGYAAEEIIGKMHFYDLFHPDDRDELKTAAFAVFAEQGIFREFKNRNVDRCGMTVWLSTSGVPIVDAAGRLLGYRGADVNITQRIEAEEARRELEVQSIKASQLATLGELSAGVAHEINNPISGVINYAQMILNRTDNEPLLSDLASRIIKEGERIAAIVRKLLSLSRQGDEVRRFHDVRELIDVPLSLFSKSLERDGITFEVVIADDIDRIVCQAQQIEQVLINLISNAQYSLNKKYSEPSAKKKILIDARRTNSGGQPALSLEITDFGTGIAADALPHVFTTFFTTKESGAGTGLGLSISENTVKAHGGDIRIESTEGEFTKVIVLLPLDTANSSRQD